MRREDGHLDDAEISVLIASEADIVAARRHGRELAAEAGFQGSDLTLIATAISELARNIVQHATQGEIVLSILRREGRTGIGVLARDSGPGIPDVELALQDGYSTARSLGLGLPGARRLMDDFEVRSEVGKGTTVLAARWVR
jgi:serine/threonine-protein kinase RsbT